MKFVDSISSSCLIVPLLSIEHIAAVVLIVKMLRAVTVYSTWLWQFDFAN